MIRYLTLSETLELYRQVMEQSGGGVGIRDPKALESTLTQPAPLTAAKTSILH
jgi:death-on-curing protein